MGELGGALPEWELVGSGSINGEQGMGRRKIGEREESKRERRKRKKKFFWFFGFLNPDYILLLGFLEQSFVFMYFKQ